jgi:transposase-like protein
MADMVASVRQKHRRKHSDEFRARVLAEVNQPGVSLKSVAEKYNLTPSLIHVWRTQKRQQEAIDSEPLGFVHYGQVADIADKDGNEHKPKRATLSVLAPRATAKETVARSIPELENIPGAAAAPENARRGVFARSDPPNEFPPVEPLDHIVGYPGERPGLIDIHMPQGVRILVDAFVNEKALARVLKSLKAAA